MYGRWPAVKTKSGDVTFHVEGGNGYLTLGWFHRSFSWEIPIGKSNTPLLQMHSCIVGFEKVPLCVLESSKSCGPLCSGLPRGVLLRSLLSCWVLAASSGGFFLGNSAPEPVQLYVHGIEAFACNVVGYHSVGGRIVGLHWHGRLFVSHYLDGVTFRDGLPAVDEESSHFRFCHGGHDGFDDLGDGDNGSVVCRNG